MHVKLSFIQVPLGILLHNENKVDDMCKILEKSQKYVPTIVKQQTTLLPNGEPFTSDCTEMWQVLFGGDQLTVARCKGAAAIRSSHLTASERLEGVIPVLEDWHSRMTFLKVSCWFMK